MHCLLGSEYLTCLLDLKSTLCCFYCFSATLTNRQTFNSIILSTHCQDVLFTPSILSKISFFVSQKKDETTENKDVELLTDMYMHMEIMGCSNSHDGQRSLWIPVSLVSFWFSRFLRYVFTVHFQCVAMSQGL